MISPAPYQVNPAALSRSKTLLPFGSVWLITPFAAMTFARTRAMAIRRGSMRSGIRPRWARSPFMSDTRSVPDLVRMASVTSSWSAAETVPARGTSSATARMTDARRRVEVSTDGSSSRDARGGMGRPSGAAVALVPSPDRPGHPPTTPDPAGPPGTLGSTCGTMGATDPKPTHAYGGSDVSHPTRRGDLVRRPHDRFGDDVRRVVRLIHRSARGLAG